MSNRPYQFALIKYRPDAAAGECLNVGVVMWCPTEGRLVDAAVTTHYRRLSNCFRNFDGRSYRKMAQQLNALLKRCEGRRDVADSLAKVLDYIVPDLGASFQYSDIKGGLVSEPAERFKELMHFFVLRHENRQDRERRNDDAVWTGIKSTLRDAGVLKLLRPKVRIATDKYDYEFRAGWQNGKTHVLEALSFDYAHQGEVIEKATIWTGRLFNLADAQFAMHAIVSPPTEPQLRPYFDRAMGILRSARPAPKIYLDDQPQPLITTIKKSGRPGSIIAG